jgi:hypothetical protein
MKHFDHLLALLLFFAVAPLVISGCAATSYQAGEVTYKSDSFSVDDLESGGLAVLPAVTAEGVEGYRRPFGEALNDVVADVAGDSDHVTWQETMDLINAADLATPYNRAIATYRETSIIDLGFVQEMGNALGVRYLLFVQLDEPEFENKVKRGLLSPGYRRKERIGVSAFAQVWDAVTGDVVWEGVGNAGIREKNEMAIIKGEQRDLNIYSRRVAEEIVRRLYDGDDSNSHGARYTGAAQVDQ